MRITENLIGGLAPVVGIITSFQENLEWGLRVASVAVGLAIGVIHLIRLLRK